MQATDGQWQQVPESSSLESSTSSKAVGNTKEKVALLSLTEVFGYFEGSKSNTIALVRKVRHPQTTSVTSKQVHEKIVY